MQITSYNLASIYIFTPYSTTNLSTSYKTWSSTKLNQIIFCDYNSNFCTYFASCCFWLGCSALSDCLLIFHLSFKTQFKCQLLFETFPDFPCRINYSLLCFLNSFMHSLNNNLLNFPDNILGTVEKEISLQMNILLWVP